MNKELDILLSDLDTPSVDMEIATEQSNSEPTEVKYSDVPEMAENQILAEGAADIQDHPELEGFLRTLNDLKNEFHQKVVEASKDHELSGFVKVLFSVRKKA